MMKKNLLSSLCLLITLVGYPQKFLHPYDKTLDSLYHILIKDPESTAKQQAFFDCFPHSFEELKKTYDYNLKGPNVPLYDVHEDHIFNGFAKLDKIVDTVYYKRLIDLSIGGKWKADAINIMQAIIQKKAAQKPDLLFSLLTQYSKDKIYSFWYFYFNSLHPLKGGIPQYLLEMKNKYPAIYKQMEQAFKDSDGQATT